MHFCWRSRCPKRPRKITKLAWQTGKKHWKPSETRERQIRHAWEFQTASTEGSSLTIDPSITIAALEVRNTPWQAAWQQPDSRLTTAWQQNTSMCAAVCLRMHRWVCQFVAIESTPGTTDPSTIRSTETSRPAWQTAGQAAWHSTRAQISCSKIFTCSYFHSNTFVIFPE